MALMFLQIAATFVFQHHNHHQHQKELQQQQQQQQQQASRITLHADFVVSSTLEPFGVL